MTSPFTLLCLSKWYGPFLILYDQRGLDYLYIMFISLCLFAEWFENEKDIDWRVYLAVFAMSAVRSQGNVFCTLVPTQ